jgi:hypothetical protein
MFPWSRPRCPCDPAAKRWVEDRLQWLTKQFGLHILLERPVILPTEEFFPDTWDGTPEAARRMFERVCEYIGVKSYSVNLEIFTDKTPGFLGGDAGFAAGTWSTEGGSGALDRFSPREFGAPTRGTIRLERSVLDRPDALVGVMAHELSHQRLLGENRYLSDKFDNELLTDLTAVYYGFGVFLANDPRKSTGELKKWPGTNLHRPTYLSVPMLAYALAHIAWHRDEDRPLWSKHLRWAPRAEFKMGLKFLQKTAESSFPPVRLRGLNDERN